MLEITRTFLSKHKFGIAEFPLPFCPFLFFWESLPPPHLHLFSIDSSQYPFDLAKYLIQCGKISNQIGKIFNEYGTMSIQMGTMSDHFGTHRDGGRSDRKDCVLGRSDEHQNQSPRISCRARYRQRTTLGSNSERITGPPAWALRSRHAQWHSWRLLGHLNTH